MYQAYCGDQNEFKRSTKGIPHSNKFSMEIFKSVLLDETTPKQTVDVNSLRLDRNKNMTRTSVTKTSLSDIFLKMRVESDRITCSPLSKNGQIL